MSRSRSPPANTLLEGPTSHEDAESAVFDVLSGVGETNLLVVSYRDSPDAWLRNWREAVGDFPEEIGFVHVGVETRSSSAASASGIPTSRFPTSSSSAPSTPSSSSNSPSTSSPASDIDDVAGTLPLADAVSDPADLARVGIRASEYLEAWDANGRETVVYLDSLTQLLEHVDLSRAFSFLHLLAGRVESVDGRAYYRLDPTAHDERSVGVVRELADAVVNLDPAVDLDADESA